MKFRTTLLSKILFYYLFSLVVLIVLLLVVFQQHFRLDPNSIIRNESQEHLRSVVRLINHELHNSTEDQWKEILDRFSEAYDLKFQFCLDGCRLVFGDHYAIPEQVRKRIEEIQPPPLPEENPMMGNRPFGESGKQGRGRGMGMHRGCGFWRAIAHFLNERKIRDCTGWASR